MSGGLIVHLNGWPGVGKLTIGRVLANRLGARLVDNHLLHDVAIGCTGLADPGRWPLYEQVLHAAYEALKDRPDAETFVMTNALCANDPRERQAWDHVIDLAMARNAAFVPVVLEAGFEENSRRLRSPERVGRKLADPAVLATFMTADSIQKPDVPDLLVLDVTRLSADQAADAIYRHLRSGAGERFQPATNRHRNLQP